MLPLDIENVLGTVGKRKREQALKNHGRDTLLRMTGAEDRRKKETEMSWKHCGRDRTLRHSYTCQMHMQHERTCRRDRAGQMRICTPLHMHSQAETRGVFPGELQTPWEKNTSSLETVMCHPRWGDQT
jgi:hypothetical protein